jgi:hypothetical protein
VRTGLATLASLACTWYVPGRADDATVTQPGRLMVRFQLSDSWAGTPRRSSARRSGWPRVGIALVGIALVGIALVSIRLVGIGLARVVFVTISVPIHTESMQATAGPGVQTRRPEGVPR